MSKPISCRRPIEVELPEKFSRISDIAYNLWWSWTPKARQLFSFMEPERWIRYHNPIELLMETDEPRWNPLKRNEEFLSLYNRVVEDFERYMKPPADEREDDLGGKVAYFSTEFGLHDSIPIYSGGLGVLSGDHLKSASDRNLPLIGVGLFYRNGYFRQFIDSDGTQHHLFPKLDFSRLPVQRVLNRNGQAMFVECPLKQWTVKLKVWKFQVGRIPLILLDSDCPENPPEIQPITSQLYVRDREMRLCQEIILGVGGAKALSALDWEPSVWHMNEGHSVFLITERLRERSELGDSFMEARNHIREDTLFTTHTPVPAGHEVYNRELIEEYFQPQFDEMDYDFDRFYQLGINEVEESGDFNLTALALRFSGKNNAVSKLHAEVSNRMWGHVVENEEKPEILPITNGIHVPTWLGYDIRDVLDVSEQCWGKSQCQNLREQLNSCPDGELWQAHKHQKQRFIRMSRDIIGQQRARHGQSPDELSKVQNLIDSDALLIGFARRFATYKRATMLFRDFERIREIMCSEERPVQVVFAGKAHPADQHGQQLIKDIYQLMNHSELRDRITFVENYNMHIASLMVQGVDVWLNTPRRPNEASGTSGMKAALNGVLNLSIVDGWWAEGYDGSNGWNIGHGEEYEDKARQDHEDAQNLYRTLEEEVVPTYYNQNKEGIPTKWVEMMRSSILSTVPQFSTHRMVNDYEDKAYRPLCQGSMTEKSEVKV